MHSTSFEYRILDKVKKITKGTLFFTEDFVEFGSAKAIAKALERLVNQGELSRVARGIYARLDVSPVLGELLPTTEQIALAISRRDMARIMPTGALALNALGLSTQVPMNVVYLTDGAARKIEIGRRKIVFKKSVPKNLAAKGKISGLVIQALKDIGKDQVTDHEINIILDHLRKEEVTHVQHDIKLAPEWIRAILRKVL
ncbi:DUF6088 family protein [Aquirufa sp. KTFRIE-69F]|jgi:predicted transcriptional regulator of viral defense system|uniref:DUF6088 family protein n=1 Tax=Aquirufa originis TaxID=3096514 RepID=A0ABW6DF71_9BACT